MGAFRLRHRYLIVLVLFGALLTCIVAVLTLVGGVYEQRMVVDLVAGVARGSGAETVAALDRVQGLLLERIHGAHLGRLWVVVLAGPALTALVSWLVSSRMRRIDAAVDVLVGSAERIGHGSYSEPVRHSGVDEVAPLEGSLERMRQALTLTTISRDYLNLLLNSMSDAVLAISPDGRVRTANLAAARLLGLEPGQLEGLSFEGLLADAHRAAFSLDRVVAEPGETVVQTSRGQTIPVSVSASVVSSESADFRGHILVLRDITERKRAERRIRYLARFDALTKMPNRMQFQHLLHQAIARTTRQSRGLALLYVDIDNFKEVNDTFGHEAGDRVLETMGERLARVLPKDSVVGRLAGDEFAIFAEGTDDSPAHHDQAGALARIVLREVSRPLHVGEQEIEVTASVGVALCPEQGDNVIDLPALPAGKLEYTCAMGMYYGLIAVQPAGQSG